MARKKIIPLFMGAVIGTTAGLAIGMALAIYCITHYFIEAVSVDASVTQLEAVQGTLKVIDSKDTWNDAETHYKASMKATGGYLWLNY